MNHFKDYLNAEGIEYRCDATLKELTTFKVGGKAECVVYPGSVEECKKILSYTHQKNMKVIYLGNGSNILGDDRGCKCVLLKTERLDHISLKDNNVLSLGSGVRLVKVSAFAQKNELTGFEFAHGIPGSVGGAVFMNAGAYDGTMKQVVLRTKYLNPDGTEGWIESDAHCFDYRHSFFMDHPELLIVETEILLSKGNSNEISAKIKDFQQRRVEKQPLEYPSAGSTFKRPQGYFAGKLIQDAGLRGYQIGGAQVSEKHCGFVINRENATSEDVKGLIQHIQKEVFDQFGVSLHCEVQFLEID